MWNESRNNVTHCHFTRFSKFKIYISGLQHWECKNKPREKKSVKCSRNNFFRFNIQMLHIVKCHFIKMLKFVKWKLFKKLRHPFFCRKNDVIDDVSQNLWHHFFYKNIMGPRTFYGAKLLISRSLEKNFGLTIFTSGVFRCSIPVKSWTKISLTKMQELILQSFPSSIHKYSYWIWITYLCSPFFVVKSHKQIRPVSNATKILLLSAGLVLICLIGPEIFQKKNQLMNLLTFM